MRKRELFLFEIRTNRALAYVTNECDKEVLVVLNEPGKRNRNDEVFQKNIAQYVHHFTSFMFYLNGPIDTNKA